MSDHPIYTLDCLDFGPRNGYYNLLKSSLYIIQSAEINKWYSTKKEKIKVVLISYFFMPPYDSHVSEKEVTFKSNCSEKGGFGKTDKASWLHMIMIYILKRASRTIL